MKVLIVKDDPRLAATLRRLLRRQKFVVDVAHSLQLARSALEDNAYEVVLLDRLLPDGDGTELLAFARRQRLRARFIIVSALGETGQRVEGLDHGADDYITKPFEPEELYARIRAAGRRPVLPSERVLALGNLSFDCYSRNFTVNGQLVVLTRRATALVEKLLERGGRVVTRNVLDAALYGFDDFVQANALETQVSRLRKQLATADANVSIHTIRGVGYMLTERPERAS